MSSLAYCPLTLYIAAISLGACGWLQGIIIKGCCDNTHWPNSMPNLKPCTLLNIVPGAGAFAPQTADKRR